jgi:hypothetical protein
MRVRSPTAAAAIAAAGTGTASLRACRGCFQGLGRVLTVGDRLLQGRNILLLRRRGVSGYSAGAVPLAFASKIQLFAICSGQGNRTGITRLHLLTFEDPVTFDQ